jgi:hypothetical protein
MREFQISFLIVTGYLLVGTVLMLGSGKVAGLLKRLGTKPVTYTRVGLFTFGCCIAVLGAFGVTLHVAVLGNALGISFRAPGLF